MFDDESTNEESGEGAVGSYYLGVPGALRSWVFESGGVRESGARARVDMTESWTGWLIFSLSGVFGCLRVIGDWMAGGMVRECACFRLSFIWQGE